MKNKIKKILKQGALLCYRIFLLIRKTNKRLIVFESNAGRNYTGSPKAIYEEIVKQGLDKKYQCYYILEKSGIQIPGRGKILKRNRLHYFYIMAAAGIWVSDSRMPMFIQKKKGVHYIQTWHGTPLKKLALDMEEVSMAGESSIKEYKKNFYDNAQTWDYLISQNPFSTKIFRRAFGFSKEMLQIGYPRNDSLINENKQNIINKKKKLFGLPADKKIILYAPTWRDDEYYGIGKYKFCPQLDFNKMKKELEKDYVIIVKYHYLVVDQIDWSEFEGFIYDFDLSYDISDFYLVSDYLITDYSSVMFDYSLLKRPMFFYAYDLEKYKNQLRGFYFDFVNEVPGPIALTTEKLIQDIKEYEPQKYAKKYELFHKKFNPFDDGMASRKVVKLIESF